MTKEQWKQALVAVFIGALVTFVSSLVQSLLDLFKNHFLDISGVAASMIYYLKSRKMA